MVVFGVAILSLFVLKIEKFSVLFLPVKENSSGYRRGGTARTSSRDAKNHYGFFNKPHSCLDCLKGLAERKIWETHRLSMEKLAIPFLLKHSCPQLLNNRSSKKWEHDFMMAN